MNAAKKSHLVLYSFFVLIIFNLLPHITLAQSPTISSFTPVTGVQGTLVTINGTNFTGTTSVKFGNVPAGNFFVSSPTRIMAYVGGGASGIVSVTNASGTASLPGFTFTGPVIQSFFPTTAAKDTLVTIYGKNFTNVVAVRFGGVLATSFTILSDSVITAIVGIGASGSVAVGTPITFGLLGGFTHLGPQIASFTPRGGPTGTIVTINGNNFTGVNAVTFGGVPAASYTIVSPTVISAVTAPGSAGNIEATSIYGTGIIGGYNYPKINSFTPTSGTYGTIDTIKGLNFTGASAVYFGNIAVQSFQVLSDSVIAAVIGNGASGRVRVQNSLGGDSLGFFFYTPPPPVLTSFTPVSGSQGTIVTLRGNFLRNAYSVTFGGVPAFNVYAFEDTIMTAQPGPGASGNVVVSTSNGSASLPGFSFTGPIISSFTPANALQTDTVYISGIGFTGVDSVMFSNNKATWFSVISPTLIKAIPGNGTSGSILVFTNNGYAAKSGFNMIPIIYSFTPTSAAPGDTVTIRGRFLTNTGLVQFGGTTATWTSTLNDSTLLAVVATGSNSGNVSVTTLGGTTSKSGFVFYYPPTIAEWSPRHGGLGTNIAIIGSHLHTVTGVSVGGVPVASFYLDNPNKIIAVVDTGATGNVVVTTLGGTITAGIFQYFKKPVITSFNATQNGPGARVYIRGQNLYAIVQASGGAYNSLTVKFGGVLSPSAASNSDTVIVATVPPTVSGYVYVQTPGGKDSMPGFIFKPVPVIQTITPATATAGSTITITGSNFDPNPANNIVTFGAVRATVTGASATSLQVTVPNGASFEPLSVTVNGLTGYSRKPFVVTYAGAGNFSFDSYGSRTHINTGFKPKALVADMDGDGRNDLVVSDRMHAGIKIFLNNGTTTDTISFDAPVNIPVCSYHLLEAIRDMDGDGRPDLLLICDTSYGSGTPRRLGWYKNNSVPGTVSITAGATPFTQITNAQLPVPVDVSGDGIPDIPLAHYSSTNIGSEYIQQYQHKMEDGLPKYEFWYNIPVNNGITDSRNGDVTSIKPADINNDGFTDLIIGLRQDAGSFAGHYFTILQNNGILSLYAPQYTRRYFPGTYLKNMFPRPGDLNGDSLPDIIRDTMAYINTGNFTFTTQKNTCVDCDFVADMDGDGKPDLIKFTKDTIGIVRNKTTGPTINFAPKVNFYAGRNASHYAIGDLNGDGKPDIIISRYHDSTISILKNKVGDIIRLCPGSSTTLTSNITGATYQWQVNNGSGYTNLSDNATYSGTQTTSMNLANLPDSMSGYRYRCVTSSGNSYTFTLKFENIWTGTVSTAWENTSNWSCGTLPTRYTDVIINDGSNVTVGANAICQSLTLMPSANISVLTGFTLTVVQ